MSGVNQLAFRRSSLSEAAGQFPNGLILIEKEVKKKVPVKQNSSLVSDDILLFAKREAQRLRSARKCTPSKPRTPERRIQSARPIKSTPSRNQTPIPRAKSAQKAKLNVKSLYSMKNSPSKIETRATHIDVNEQLQHLRDEIERMADHLTSEVPAEIEDVNTAFDDESKRWFARELYSLKLECELVRKNPHRDKQIIQIVKLHRTALRAIQVAASRPILRILNPHIYSDLGGLIKELLNLSDHLGLASWDPEIILSALDQAILFPSRRNSKRNLINPQDIAPLLVPKKTVARKSSFSVPVQKGKKGPRRFFDTEHVYAQSAANILLKKSGSLQSKSKLTTKSKSKSKISPSTVSKKKTKNTKRQNLVPQRRPSYPKSKNQKATLLREISWSSGDNDNSSDSSPHHSPDREYKMARRNRCDHHCVCPSANMDSKATMEYAVDGPYHQILNDRSLEKKNKRPTRDISYVKKVSISNMTQDRSYETIRPHKPDEDEVSNKRVSNESFTGMTQDVSKIQSENMFSETIPDNVCKNGRISQVEINEMIMRLERMEKEENEMRLRLQKIHEVNHKFLTHSSTHREETDLVDYKAPYADKTTPTNLSEEDEKLAQLELIEAIEKEKEDYEEQDYSANALTNEMTELILNDVIDSVFTELEEVVDDMIGDESEKDMTENPEEINATSILSGSISSQSSQTNFLDTSIEST